MTTWLSTLFHQGGPSMYTILYLAGPALVIAIIHAIRPRRWSWWAGASLIATMLAVGLFAWRDGRGTVDDFLAREERDPETRLSTSDREMLQAQGYLEASRPLQFGGVLAGFCVLPLLVGELRRRNARRAQRV